MPATELDSDIDRHMDARYGRSPGRSRRTRWIAAGTAIAFVGVFTAWIVWGGLLGAPARIEARDTGFAILGDSEVGVTWELSVDPGSTVSCAVQALNGNFGIVGWRIVEVPASEERTRSLSASVRTTETAVSGLIYRCWQT